jgi:hypothetical protein
MGLPILADGSRHQICHNQLLLVQMDFKEGTYLFKLFFGFFHEVFIPDMINIYFFLTQKISDSMGYNGLVLDMLVGNICNRRQKKNLQRMKM